MTPLAKSAAVFVLISALIGCATRWDHIPTIEEIPPRAGSVDFTTDAGRVVAGPAPNFPREARVHRREGWVLVAGILQADGSMDEVRVLASDPPVMFDRSALDAFQSFRYEPPGATNGPLREVRFIFSFKLAKP